MFGVFGSEKGLGVASSGLPKAQNVGYIIPTKARRGLKAVEAALPGYQDLYTCVVKAFIYIIVMYYIIYLI